ncbi:MAG: hypothetical protein SF052_08265 [Bacteroidia bacterium]|nr:hypothetical protein [Bacteroidia bacterium]
MSAEDQYRVTIDQLLRQLSDLQKELGGNLCDQRRKSIERSIKQREKKLERLIPYKFRLELKILCQKAGVSGDFIS